MTGIIYNKKINKIISLILITSLLVLEVFYRTVNADNVPNQFPNTYGKGYKNEDFYLWTLVLPKSEAGNDLYKALQSYQRGSDEVKREYETGKRTFRVLFTQELCGELGSGNIGSITSKTKKSSSTFGQIIDNVIGYTTGFEYNGYAYVQADYSREVYGGSDHYGNYVYRPSTNPQLQIGRSDFVTRGPQRGFICQSVDVKNHGYKFYYPDENDEKAFLTLTYGDLGTFGGGDELFAYDDKGIPWGKDDGMGVGSNSKYIKDKVTTHDIWYVKKAETSMDATEPDYWRGNVKQDWYYEVYTAYQFDPTPIFGHPSEVYLQLSGQGFDCNRYNERDLYNFNDWMLYVGEKVDGIASLTQGEPEPILHNARTVDKPTYVKFDETYTVESDGVLFIDNLLLLNGKLVNRGIIVLEPGARIMEWDKNSGCIENYGDIILRDVTHIFVEELKTDNGQLILNGPIFANKLNITNSVVEYKNKNAALKNVEWIKEHWSGYYFNEDGTINLTCTMTGSINFASTPSNASIDATSNIVVTAY